MDQHNSPFQPNNLLRPVRLNWDRTCQYCGIPLLTKETAGFCCGPRGARLYDVRRLPPLPAEYNYFLSDPNVSQQSRRLNLLFSFAALQTNHRFPHTLGGFMAIQGRVYHQVRPNHRSSGIRWALYDGYMRNGLPEHDWLRHIPSVWTDAVATALLRVNPLTQQLRHLSTLLPHTPHANILLRDTGAAEVAAVIRYDNSAAADVGPRNLTVAPRTEDGRKSKVSVPTVSRLWEPLAYPLLFPHGSLGWGIPGSETIDLGPQAAADNDAETTQIWYYRRRLLQEPRFEIFGWLTCEYLVDMFTRNLDTRLHYIRANQVRLRQQDALLDEDGDGLPSHNVYLPVSFLGSRRWAAEQVADALAIAALFGCPTFFITMTCNPRWVEIEERLRPGQTFADIPLVVARVFAQKLSILLARLPDLFPSAGGRQYTIQVVEFQKRGLPHAHILIKFHRDCSTPQDVDVAVSAERPTNRADLALVENFMIHGCNDYCLRSGRCRFGYPKPVVQNTYIDEEGRVQYRRRSEQDSLVVAYNIQLLRMFNCHINVEVASPAQIFTYMFKYIHKGPDRVRFTVANGEEEVIDEIEDYWSGRYLSAGEAAYRILGKRITRKYPAVTALPIHLADSHTFRQYSRRNRSESQLSLLDRYFLRPLGTFINNQGDHQPFSNLRYAEYYTLFRLETWNGMRMEDRANGVFLEEQGPDGQRRKLIIQRTPEHPHICRIMMAKPSQGEVFFLRALLLHRPAVNDDELRTVDGVVYPTFQEAVERLGLFAGQREADETMAEAVAALRTPHELRLLFVDLLVTDACHSPIRIWDTFKAELSRDYRLQNLGNVEIGEQLALESLGDILALRGRSLEDFGLPVPRQFPREVLQELRRWNSDREGLSRRAAEAQTLFTHEQSAIFHEIMDAVINDRPLCMFIDGQAGRGKTFLLNAICDAVRARDDIVIPMATSAYAAQLYPGGRTAHSAFKIPVEEESIMLESSVQPGQGRAQLLQQTKVFIWDEAPMANNAAVSCAEDLLKLVMENDLPFGGKIILKVGDFRQTAPVIRWGSRAQIVGASIRSADFWQHFIIRRLTIPIRQATDRDYAGYVDAIGNGAGPEVPIEGFIQTSPFASDLIDFAFPPPVLRDPESAVKRAILAPTNSQVDEYNSIILDSLNGDSRTFLAADSIKDIDQIDGLGPDAALPILDFATRRTPPGLPSHSLMIKVGGIYRLMRNMAPERGMVKNMRCVVDQIGHRIIVVRLIRPHNGNRPDDHDTLIPRIPAEARLDSGHTIIRRQFPLAPAYATTFNSCQGLTLDRVAVDLTRPVFSHGQLYTAISRVRDRTCIVARLSPGSTTTTNVTYPELLL